MRSPGTACPPWIEDPSRFLDQWWFVSGMQSLHADAFGQQRRLLAAFLRTHPGLPEAVDRAMTAAVAQDATQVSATGQVSLSGHAQLTIGGPPTS